MDYPVHVPDTLREHLRALRKQRSLTQAQLGEKLGLGQARIAEIERHPGLVSVAQLLRLLSVLGASLVLRDGEPASTSTSAPPPASRRAAAPDPRRKGAW